MRLLDIGELATMTSLPDVNTRPYRRKSGAIPLQGWFSGTLVIDVFLFSTSLFP